jgi:hypothetical protein
VFHALGEAEERTTGYYCIPPFRWDRLRYDLLTRIDREWEPLPEPTLARVRCLRSTAKKHLIDFYRIELNDQTILAAAEREKLLDNLYPFLVYILTHEMVHLVRLSSILENWTETLAPFDESEEQRVHGISRRILKGNSEFQPVLEKFCS